MPSNPRYQHGLNITRFSKEHSSSSHGSVSSGGHRREQYQGPGRELRPQRRYQSSREAAVRGAVFSRLSSYHSRFVGKQNPVKQQVQLEYAVLAAHTATVHILAQILWCSPQLVIFQLRYPVQKTVAHSSHVSWSYTATAEHVRSFHICRFYMSSRLSHDTYPPDCYILVPHGFMISTLLQLMVNKWSKSSATASKQ